MQAGVTAPLITRVELADPQNDDEVLSAGDTLTISFDSPSNQGGRGILSAAGGRDFVDALFAFSASLGGEYTGAWTGSSTFVVTLVDASGNGFGSLTPAAAPGADSFSRASRTSSSALPLTAPSEQKRRSVLAQTAAAAAWRHRLQGLVAGLAIGLGCGAIAVAVVAVELGR